MEIGLVLLILWLCTPFMPRVIMGSITEMIPIDISRIPDIMENVFIGADLSPEEILIYTYLFKEFYNILA
jgi:hypothetical protein